MKNVENVVTVDKERHATTRILPNRDLAHVKELNMVAVTIREFGPCACNFPLAIIKNPENARFRPVAVFGLRAGENLYYGKERWDSTYAPQMIVRHPFIIGFDDKNPDTNNLTTCLETNSPFISETEGERLYDDNGEQTEFLKSRIQLLSEIFEGEKATERFMEKLQELSLLVPFSLLVKPRDGEPRKITGMYTVSEKKLRELSPEQVQELHEKDFLPAAYFMLSSLFQIHRLVQLRNLKGDEAIASYNVEFEE